MSPGIAMVRHFSKALSNSLLEFKFASIFIFIFFPCFLARSGNFRVNTGADETFILNVVYIAFRSFITFLTKFFFLHFLYLFCDPEMFLFRLLPTWQKDIKNGTKGTPKGPLFIGV